jgi:tetratricopeptide (TPR) repeat protein
MTPDTEALVVRELRRIRISFSLIAAAAVAAVIFICAFSLYAMRSVSPAVPVGEISTGPCSGESFYNAVSSLLDAAKYKEAIASSEERLKTCPGDPYAWFYKAKALAVENQWDAALESLNRAELLRPDWLYAYTKPLRESIDRNKSKSK